MLKHSRIMFIYIWILLIYYLKVQCRYLYFIQILVYFCYRWIFLLFSIFPLISKCLWYVHKNTICLTEVSITNIISSEYYSWADFNSDSAFQSFCCRVHDMLESIVIKTKNHHSSSAAIFDSYCAEFVLICWLVVRKHEPILYGQILAVFLNFRYSKFERELNLVCLAWHVK